MRTYKEIYIIKIVIKLQKKYAEVDNTSWEFNVKEIGENLSIKIQGIIKKS